MRDKSKQFPAYVSLQWATKNRVNLHPWKLPGSVANAKVFPDTVVTAPDYLGDLRLEDALSSQGLHLLYLLQRDGRVLAMAAAPEARAMVEVCLDTTPAAMDLLGDLGGSALWSNA